MQPTVCKTTKNKSFRNWPKAVFPPGCICFQLFPAPRLAHLPTTWRSLHTVHFKHTPKRGIWQIKITQNLWLFCCFKTSLTCLTHQQFVDLPLFEKCDTETVQTDCPYFMQYVNTFLLIYVIDTPSCVITKIRVHYVHQNLSLIFKNGYFSETDETFGTPKQNTAKMRNIIKWKSSLCQLVSYFLNIPIKNDSFFFSFYCRIYIYF